MKYRVTVPEFVVSLKQLSVHPPSIDDEGALRISALTSLREVVRSRTVAERAPILSEAAHTVGSVQIRSMGTLGGNLCLETRCLYYNQGHEFQYVEPCFKRGGDRCYLVPKGRRCWAVFMGDTVPALVARDARVEVASSSGPRTIPLEELYTNDSLSPISLLPVEILCTVVIPVAAGKRGEAFVKSSVRGGLDFAIVSAAAVLETEDSGTCSRASLVLGSVGARPLRAAQAEAQLRGRVITKELIREAARLAATEIRPVMHHERDASYLRHSVGVAAEDALSLAFDRLSV
jgi:CO/xanthine dehydrogenase FAD-binding subunit